MVIWIRCQRPFIYNIYLFWTLKKIFIKNFRVYLLKSTVLNPGTIPKNLEGLKKTVAKLI